MSARSVTDAEVGEGGVAREELPWVARPLRRALESEHGHAMLIHGSGGVGQFELALALAKGWLCEDLGVPLADRPCGRCASCKLHQARSHPDLLVLVPEALRESLGWDVGGEGEEGGEGKRKPSKEVRVEAVRAAIAFATTTSARGRGKVVVIHPAERMNDVAASAFLKTLEEPVGNARFILCSSSPDSLLPTIRSRCQHVALPVPPAREVEAWLASRGVAQPAVLLAASGGLPQEAFDDAARGVDAAAWLALPRRVAAGDATALHGWGLPAAVDALQKICHDSAALACGATPRFFPSDQLVRDASIGALLRWSRELTRVAAEADHPWSADLAIESLVGQGREALKTPRSPDRRDEGMSLNSAG